MYFEVDWKMNKTQNFPQFSETTWLKKKIKKARTDRKITEFAANAL